MTLLLLALGWPLALLFAWRWRIAYRGWTSTLELCDTLSESVRDMQELADDRFDEAREWEMQAKDWESAALIWQAVVLAPLRSDAFRGRMQ